MPKKLTPHAIATYLKRTEKLLEHWKTIPPDRVRLNVVTFNPKTGNFFIAPEKMMECGAVGCLAGWANTFLRKPAAPCDIILHCNDYYGVNAFPWYGRKEEELFDLRMYASLPQWEEARRRLVSRIAQLKRKQRSLA